MYSYRRSNSPCSWHQPMNWTKFLCFKQLMIFTSDMYSFFPYFVPFETLLIAISTLVHLTNPCKRLWHLGLVSFSKFAIYIDIITQIFFIPTSPFTLTNEPNYNYSTNHYTHTCCKTSPYAQFLFLVTIYHLVWRSSTINVHLWKSIRIFLLLWLSSTTIFCLVWLSKPMFTLQAWIEWPRKYCMWLDQFICCSEQSNSSPFWQDSLQVNNIWKVTRVPAKDWIICKSKEHTKIFGCWVITYPWICCLPIVKTSIPWDMCLRDNWINWHRFQHDYHFDQENQGFCYVLNLTETIWFWVSLRATLLL